MFTCLVLLRFSLEIYHSQVVLSSSGTITEVSSPLLDKIEHMFQARSVGLVFLQEFGVEQSDSKLGELFYPVVVP